MCTSVHCCSFFQCSPIPEELQQSGGSCDGSTAIGNVHEDSSEGGKEELMHCLGVLPLLWKLSLLAEGWVYTSRNLGLGAA